MSEEKLALKKIGSRKFGARWAAALIPVKTKPKRIIGWTLIVAGALVFIFCDKIVFPGLEHLIGIETIVGKQNVVYQTGGSYLFTNPGAMHQWGASVAAIGILICFLGVWLIHSARKPETFSLETN